MTINFDNNTCLRVHPSEAYKLLETSAFVFCVLPYSRLIGLSALRALPVASKICPGDKRSLVSSFAIAACCSHSRFTTEKDIQVSSTSECHNIKTNVHVGPQVKVLVVPGIDVVAAL